MSFEGKILVHALFIIAVSWMLKMYYLYCKDGHSGEGGLSVVWRLSMHIIIRLRVCYGRFHCIIVTMLQYTQC